MKSFYSQMQQKLRLFSESLHEKQVFRKIGITYQVFWNLFLIVMIVGLMSIFFIGGTAAGYFASLVKDEPLRSPDEMVTDIYDYEETSQLFFADDTYLGELPTELERHQVSLDQMSDHVKNAVIATEDEHFFEHEGIVPKAILRATFQEVANSSVQTGGSTLTQQLIKQQVLSSEVSFDRKATEILLAMRLEHFLEKEEILEAYLNVVPFGRNASGRQVAGVQAASQGLFGVDAKDLSIPQAAFIAGLPQSPFGYTPFTGNGEVKENLDPGLNRMQTVLRRMHEGGFINDREYEEALEFDLRENLTDRTPSPIEEYPYLTHEVMRRASDILYSQKLEEHQEELNELEGDERQLFLTDLRSEADADLRRKGFRIHTTIDKNVYNAMQEAVNDHSLFGPQKGDDQEEVGAVLIENHTGAIKGFVGGRGEGETTNHYNYATQAYRSNGSTMKPLLAYGPALEIGVIQPGIVVPDTPATYSGGQPYSNFDNSYAGLISVRESLARSRNVPAVRSFQRVPHEQLRETMINLGFTPNDESQPYESAALGGAFDVTVEQNTSAFSTFGNGGNRTDPFMIERIETADGDIVFEHEIKQVNVFTPQTNYLSIDMMRDVLRAGGTASSVPGRLKFSADWAGKTGTTGEFRDSWFVATNPNVTLGVWIGYRQNQPIDRVVNGLRYGPRTQRIWANIANAAYDQNPNLLAPSESFAMPEGIVRRSVCSITGQAPTSLCEQAGLVRSDLFNVNFQPGSGDNLDSARYVTINSQNYLALDSTPQEFTDVGVTVPDTVFGVSNIGEYLPDSMQGVVPDRDAPNNGRSPGAVSGVSLNGQTLSWSKHSDNDIVGYRIYRAASGSSSFERVGHVKGNGSTSYTVNGGSFAYYVTAVDTAGRESTSSSQAEGSDYSDTPEPSEPDAPDTEPSEPDEDPPSEQNGGNDNDGGNGDSDGNGNGNGNGNGSGNGNGNGNGNQPPPEEPGDPEEPTDDD
ncbi:transglycosylase domain-containing protein [Alkalihalophilus marmarensis]|uniref:Penicillin-binding protein 1A n=1 Tax=Alkalihalophilus marmarensis DSM 21297 TaxID=1188261 RepID=U6SN66_9BACI|nr:transglycosylase domain-containing protein [Alkalihalophilus marmarensis]ERN52325.1 penicillin-binding protein 1A [Alkalihalophilus marmarensis DSM 21297]